jgi:Bacteroidetes-specific putative membrane protein
MRGSKNILIAVALVMFALSAKAQQAPIFTNYTNSYAYVNPGFAGLSDGINLLGLYRQQWAGFTDADGNKVAPQTFLLTGDVPIKLFKGGISFGVVQDKIGFENNTNVDLGYSYHLDMGGSTVGLGAALNVLNRNVDFSMFDPTNGNDPILEGLGKESSMLLDFNLGAFWQIPESLYLGFSVTNVLETMGKSLSSNSTSSASFTTDRTFYLLAGYQFQFETLPAYVFLPSIGVMSDLASTQINISGKVLYNNLFSFGVNYRPQESIGLMVGLLIKDIMIGYAYDVNTMGLGVPGSHEIAVSYCFKLNFDKSPKDYRSVRYL